MQASADSPLTPVRSGQRVHKFEARNASAAPLMNRLQASFYRRIFRPAFIAGDPVDVGSQEGYGIVMLHELLDQFETDPFGAEDGLRLLMKAYPDTAGASAAEDCLRDVLLLQARWAEAFELRMPIWNSLSMTLGLAPELGHPRLKPKWVFSWGQGRISRTTIRKLDFEDVFGFLAAELEAFHAEHGISLLEDFWKRVSAELPVAAIVESVRDDVGPNLDDNDIAWSINRAREWGLTYQPTAFAGFEGRERPIPVPRPWPRPEFFGPVWNEFLRWLLRRAENKAREQAGLSRVGEHLISETKLLNELRAAFPSEVIDHQVRPLWLSPQSLDIVFTRRRIAVEYQGAQHSRPVEYFGGEEVFEQQQWRDTQKRALCEDNGMQLIEVHPDYMLDEVVAQIRDLIEQPQDEDP